MSEARRGWWRRRGSTPTTQPSAPAGTVDAVGLVDPSWYALQTSDAAQDAEGVWKHYVAHGRHHLLSPHPLFVPDAPEPSGRAGPTPFERALAGEGRRPFPSLRRPSAPTLFRDVDAETPLDVTVLGDDARLTWGELRPLWRRHAEVWYDAARLDPPGWSPERPSTPPRPPASSTTVSVVLATWNRAVPLQDAIASVRAQSHAAWELLVVDDGSEDDTADVVRAVAADDERVVLVPRPHLGVCAARNAGLAAATGDLVAFLDSDNTWEPDYLAHMVHAFDSEPELESAYAVLAGLHEGVVQYRTTRVDYDVLRVRNHVDLNVLVVRASVLDVVGVFDESLRRCVDYDLVLRLAARTPPRLVPYVGSMYDSDPDADRITTREAPTWPELVRLRHNVDWPAKQRESLTSGVSVVLPVDRDTSALTDVLTAVREALGETAWEVVVVDSTPSPRLAAALAVVAAVEPRMRYLRRPVPTTWPVGTSLGVTAATHDLVLVVGEGHELDGAAVAELVRVVRARPRSVVQPVVAMGEAVLATGAQVVDGQPEPVTLRHVERAPELAGLAPVLDLPAGHGLTFATSTALLAELGGVDPLMGTGLGLLDLTLRAHGLGDVEVLLAARAVARRGVDRPTARTHPATLREFDRRHRPDVANVTA